MLELYHFGFSTCSQKVRLVLAEKQLDFVSHEIDILGGGQHDPAYVQLNPNHVVPTLVHDGAVLIESTLINEYLDDAFPEMPLRAGDAGRAGTRLRLWTKLLDEKVHAATAVGDLRDRPARRSILQQPAGAARGQHRRHSRSQGARRPAQRDRARRQGAGVRRRARRR